MHVRLLAVGDRQPDWIDSGFQAFSARLPRQWQFRLDEINSARRKKNRSVAGAKDDEGERLLGKVKGAEFVVLLDERGTQFTSVEFSTRLGDWQALGQDLVFIIGGPDGVSHAVGQRANLCWSLSRLTLPHGLVRVLFVEQLYRAWSLANGHPYHRE